MKKFSKSIMYKEYYKKNLEEKIFFEKNGLKGDALEDVMEYTHSQFVEDCYFYKHNMSLDSLTEGMEEEGRSPLLKKYVEKMSCEIDLTKYTYLGWIGDIEDERIYKVLKMLEKDELIILTEIAIKHKRIIDTAEMLGYSRHRTSRKYKGVLNKIKEAITTIK